MRRLSNILIPSIIIVILCFFFYSREQRFKNILPKTYTIGAKIDSLNGVYVYYNKSISNVSGRNTIDGYNVGLKYQCVEFVKRYYYKVYKHKMPNSYGHAKDFFNPKIRDGALNKERGLIQFCNGSKTKPVEGDLVVLSGSIFNKYGHVAIVSNVDRDEIELIQQNTGKTTRVEYKLSLENNLWHIKQANILGWLRKE